MCATCNVLRSLLIDRGMSPALAMSIGSAMEPIEDAALGAAKSAVKKTKRKVSKYARTYGQAYKRLKAKHPRSKHQTLVKRAHAEAKRLMKKK